MQINKSNNYLRIPKDIEHNIVEIEGETTPQRLSYLEELIQISPSLHFLIFCESNDEVHEVSDYLKMKNVPTVCYSGKMMESERTRNVNLFLTKAYTCFVCSDAVNRGLHFDFPVHLVQYDCARNLTSLIHRIGRTGRLGNRPIVTSFIKEIDRPMLLNMQQMIGNRPVSEFRIISLFIIERI